MRRSHRNAAEEVGDHCATASEVTALVRRMNCARAAGPATIGAPLSRELFLRVDCEGQGLAEAARALGLGPRDGVYLLAGLRRDMAVELVTTLLAANLVGANRHPEGSHCASDIDTPLNPKGDPL